MGTNLIVALVIGSSAPPWAFAAAMGVGIAVGIVGSLVLLKYVPEPEGYRSERPAASPRPRARLSRKSPSAPSWKSLFLLSLVAGMARTFLPVYAKDVFTQGDDAVMAYSLVASVGALAMGLLTRLLVDRLGAKPLYVVFAAVTALSLAPLALAPGAVGPLAGPLGAAILLGLVNFLSSFGLAGEENAGQTYFFSLVSAARTLDLGVVYFLVYGLGGTIGAGAGGLILDGLGALGLGHVAAYRIFFGFLLLVLAWVLARMGGLVRLGSASVRESIGVMLSLRDLRAFNLLSRLDKSADPAEEIDLIRELGAPEAARAAPRGRPRRASSTTSARRASTCGSRPCSRWRISAARSRELVDALPPRWSASPIRPPTSRRASSARARPRARARARWSWPTSGAPPPRRTTCSRPPPWWPWPGWATGRASRRIEDTLASSRIPRVRISAAYALELLGSRSSVPVLVSCLRSERDPAFVSDELLLSTAVDRGHHAALLRPVSGFHGGRGGRSRRVGRHSRRASWARPRARPACDGLRRRPRRLFGPSPARARRWAA